MQEMIYLSDRKLAQFLPELRSAWPRPRISLTTPFGGVEVDTAAGRPDTRTEHLTKVVRRIEENAGWFTEEGLRPGQWVAFEAPLNHVVLDDLSTDMVLFVDAPEASKAYPTGGAVRLLLHGSPEHLVSGAGRRQPAEVTVPGAEEEELVRNVLGGGASAPGGLLAALFGGLEAGEGQKPSLVAAIWRMISRLDERTYPEMAAWMRGYARITTGIVTRDGGPGLVVASPLYVEYGDEQDQGHGF